MHKFLILMKSKSWKTILSPLNGLERLLKIIGQRYLDFFLDTLSTGQYVSPYAPTSLFN